MKIRGQFLHNGDLIDNTVIGQGVSLFLRSLFRAESVMPADFYIGLTNSSVDFLDGTALATAAATEPSGHGYARQATVRGTSDWTVELVNGVYRARSKVVTFTASSDYTQAYSRLFLTDQASGTAGIVFAVSGPTPDPVLILNGAGPSCGYIFNMGG